eukprot:4832193-Pyramimonas_sp.AAC.1
MDLESSLLLLPSDAKKIDAGPLVSRAKSSRLALFDRAVARLPACDQHSGAGCDGVVHASLAGIAHLADLVQGLRQHLHFSAGADSRNSWKLTRRGEIGATVAVEPPRKESGAAQSSPSPEIIQRRVPPKRRRPSRPQLGVRWRGRPWPRG